jgi:hypothetical protein
LVKSHLTSAVNEEIVALKKQIKLLTEKCNRLEQENTILKKHALPETLSLIGAANTSSTTTSSVNHSISMTNSTQSLTAANGNKLSSIPNPINDAHLLSIELSSQDTMISSFNEAVSNDPNYTIDQSSYYVTNQVETAPNVQMLDKLNNSNETKM